jgi:cell division protein ZapE
MDIFFACARVAKKRRTHFHAFMLEVHERMHAIRKSGTGRADVASVARQIVERDGTLFCFDGFLLFS